MLVSTLLRHPLTGQPIVPVGYRKDGRPIWPIMGGSEEAGGGDTDGDAGDTSDSGDKTGGDAAGDADKADDDTSGDKTGDKTEAEDVKSLPGWAQKLISTTRQQAASSRTEAKTKAADEAKQELAQTIGKALGLVKGEDKIDPEKLATDLTTAQTTARQSQLELAVYKAAGTAQGNPDALLDSRSFLAKVADLNPTDKGFDKALSDQIADAVKQNPNLKSGRAPGTSSVDHPGGGSATKRTEAPTMHDAVNSALGT